MYANVLHNTGSSGTSCLVIMMTHYNTHVAVGCLLHAVVTGVTRTRIYSFHCRLTLSPRWQQCHAVSPAPTVRPAACMYAANGRSHVSSLAAACRYHSDLHVHVSDA